MTLLPDATPIPQHSCWRCSKAWRVTARALVAGRFAVRLSAATDLADVRTRQFTLVAGRVEPASDPADVAARRAVAAVSLVHTRGRGTFIAGVGGATTRGTV